MLRRNLLVLLAKLRRFKAGLIASAGAFVILYSISGTGCWLYATTGFPCPGCGTTRAAVCLLHGDWKGMLGFHPLLPILVITFAMGLGLFATRQKQPRWFGRYVLPGVAVLYLLVYVVRLAMFFPDTPPMVWNRDSILFRLLALLGIF